MFIKAPYKYEILFKKRKKFHYSEIQEKERGLKIYFSSLFPSR